MFCESGGLFVWLSVVFVLSDWPRDVGVASGAPVGFREGDAEVPVAGDGVAVSFVSIRELLGDADALGTKTVREGVALENGEGEATTVVTDAAADGEADIDNDADGDGEADSEGETDSEGKADSDGEADSDGAEEGTRDGVTLLWNGMIGIVEAPSCDGVATLCRRTGTVDAAAVGV